MFGEGKRRLLLLSIILVLISMIVTSVAIMLLYQVAEDERLDSLIVSAQSQARLIESMARHDRVYSQMIQDEEPDYDATEATLQQVIRAHESFRSFCETGEFNLGQKSGEKIVFRFRHHADKVLRSQPIPFSSKLAEPMRRALSGQSGSMIGLDYAGKTVLAAYEPVADLNLGVVAKIDLAEVRRPFIHAAIVSFSVAFTLILLGVVLLRKTIEPLFNRLHATSEELAAETEQHKQALVALKESDERFQQIADVSEDVFWLIDISDPQQEKFLYVSKAYETKWQRSIDALMKDPRSWLELVHPDDRGMLEKEFKRMLLADTPVTLEFRSISREGQVRHILGRSAPIFAAAGNMVRIAGILQDISVIKEAELTIQNANLELENRIAERTSELQRTIKLMTGREIRMSELKNEIRRLKEQLQKKENIE